MERPTDYSNGVIIIIAFCSMVLISNCSSTKIILLNYFTCMRIDYEF